MEAVIGEREVMLAGSVQLHRSARRRKCVERKRAASKRVLVLAESVRVAVLEICIRQESSDSKDTSSAVMATVAEPAPIAICWGAGHRTQAAGPLAAAGRWPLDAGRWTLDAGRRAARLAQYNGLGLRHSGCHALRPVPAKNVRPRRSDFATCPFPFLPLRLPIKVGLPSLPFPLCPNASNQSTSFSFALSHLPTSPNHFFSLLRCLAALSSP